MRKLVAEIPAMILFLSLAFWAGNIPGFFLSSTTGLDDASMYLRYAYNFEHGCGIAWNPSGEQTLGVTSMLYLLALLLMRQVLNVGLWDQMVTLSWFFASVTLGLLCIWGYRRHVRGEPQERFFVPGIIAFTAAAHVSFRGVALNGMETSLGLLCGALLAILTLKLAFAPHSSLAALVGLVGYLLFAARPDCGVYSVLFPSLALASLRKPGWGRSLIVFLGTLTVLVSIDTAVKWWWFGDPLPLPFYVKRYGFLYEYLGVGLWDPYLYLLDVVSLSAPLLLTIGLFARGEMARIAGVFVVPMVVHIAYLSSVVQIMGYYGRYYVPVWSFLAVLALGAFVGSSKEISYRGRRVGVVVVAALLCCALSWRRGGTQESALTKSPDWHQSLVEIVNYLEQNPQIRSLAATEHGYLSARFPALQIIDLTGLHDPTFAKAGFSVDKLLARRPDLIWYPPPAYAGIVSALNTSPGLGERYSIDSEALGFGAALRRRDEPEG